MKVFILVAGRGTRISRDIGGLAKCLLEVGTQQPLISHTLETLIKYGVSPPQIVLINGYQSIDVENAVRPYGVTVVTNPFYDVTNSIASFWFAREFIDGEFIALNGDTFFDVSILDSFKGARDEFVLLGDTSRTDTADYKLGWTPEGLLLKYGKDLSVDETTGEYTGLAFVSKEGAGKFYNRLDALVSGQKHYMWWEDVIYSLSTDGEPVRVVDIKDKFWAEVDYIEDYLRILRHVRGLSK